MSRWLVATVAATKAVRPPMMAMVSLPACEYCTTQLIRHSRYTPAVTMVAAWMSADTGVGPSMASGSQLNSGICALFPLAASSRASTVKVMTTGDMAPELIVVKMDR